MSRLLTSFASDLPCPFAERDKLARFVSRLISDENVGELEDLILVGEKN